MRCRFLGAKAALPITHSVYEKEKELRAMKSSSSVKKCLLQCAKSVVSQANSAKETEAE